MTEKTLRKKSGKGPSAEREAAQSSEREEEQRGEPDQTPALPPIAAFGASAGGFESFKRVLEALPASTGLAFVYIQHHGPDVVSRAAPLLGRCTSMPVELVEDGACPAPNHVYVAPPDRVALFQGGRFVLSGGAPSAAKLPVDAFFRALGEELRERAIAVVLSGMGSDGALGTLAVKSEGGITIAESELTAKYPAMPRSAVETGAVDFVLPAEKIAAEVAMLARRLRALHPEPPEPGPEGDRSLSAILAILRGATGVDFTHYRQTTLRRRIQRRMLLQKLGSFEEYAQWLRDHPNEVAALYHDVLIRVTSFFRDPEVFRALKEKVFPALLEDRAPDAPLRIWVPGCSTGEEPYSIAMALLELMADRRASFPIQIFATDVSEAAIEKARAGVYLENIALDVSPERLQRFFTKTDKGYQISRSIRDMCVFAHQDVTSDPPFSKLDLVSCRNLLIYLEPVLQRRVMPIFHYALKPAGFLLLGTSETAGSFSELFEIVDRGAKIYEKSGPAPAPRLELSGPVPAPLRERPRPRPESALGDLQKEADRVMLARFAPPGVVVNEQFQIVQFRGRTGPYLEPAPGEASLHVLRMAREGLMVELRAALQKAQRSGEPARTGVVQVRGDGEARDVVVEVIPIRPARADAGEARAYLVLFEDVTEHAAPPAPRRKPAGKPAAESDEVRRLKQELSATREYLQAIIEEQEATNEELQSANEEVLSSNEELQSINEELETAKEELQSTNEELTTLNDELQTRNAELYRANGDLESLLGSIALPIVILGRDLRILRFTPGAEQVLRLVPTDIGRAIGDIDAQLELPDLEQQLADVVATGHSLDREVKDRAGRWWSLRIRPYSTTDGAGGAVLCFVDIDDLKRHLDFVGAR